MLESLLSHYCIFFRDSRMEFGWIEKIQKNKALVIPMKGKMNLLPANRIAFSWKDKKLPTNASTAHESIAKQVNEANKFKNTFEIETMHSLLDIKEYSLDELSENFLDDPKNPIHKLGLFLSLRDDLIWFKQNRNLTYTPRTKEEIKLIKIQLNREKKIKEKTTKFQKWINDIESGNWGNDYIINSEKALFINQLIDLLIEGSESIHWKEMSTILNLGSYFGIDQENKLKKWLSQAGANISWSRLILLRSRVKDNFGKDIYNEVKNIKEKSLAKTKLFPENIPTYTIDSEKTLDYDDAFSILEWSKNSLKIVVHITDLSHYLDSFSPIFKEAESRISSIYSIGNYFPMLPKELSNEIFSLKAGTQKNVISFFFNLSKNGEWSLLEIDSRRLNVHKNLSYGEANRLIEDKKDFWDLLNRSCLFSQKNRINNGALNIIRKEFEFDIDDPENIKIILLNRNSPASRIIEEMAISVNSETGKLFQKSSFPGIYRTQSSYEILEQVEDGTGYKLEQVRVNPSKLTTIPDKHAGLGCKFYIQVTSPIRRFSDLIMQLQLKLILKNATPLFSEEELIKWSEEISYRQKKYKRAEIEILNHWKLLFLKQNLDQVFSAKIKRKMKNGNVEIDILELELTIASSGLENSSVGEKIFIKIDHVDTQNNKIKVQSNKNRNEEFSLSK